MKKAEELLTEINKVKRQIETDYPELDKYLDENPITIPNFKNPQIGIETLQEYLDSLTSLIEKYKKEHK
jgi:hypothetical protein